MAIIKEFVNLLIFNTLSWLLIDSFGQEIMTGNQVNDNG